MGRAAYGLRFAGRAWPLVLLLIMVAIGILLELMAFPPLKIWVKAPILLLLMVGLYARRADADPGRN